jgi:hypothetical protein
LPRARREWRRRLDEHLRRNDSFRMAEKVAFSWSHRSVWETASCWSADAAWFSTRISRPRTA